VSEDAITILTNAIIQITGISNSSSDIHATVTASSLAMTSFGIPLTGSMSAGFTIGFIKG
jgi:ribonuclease PH